MKPLPHPILVALFGMVATSQTGIVSARSIYKCVGADSAVAYQGEPCATGAVETQLAVAGATSDAVLASAPGNASSATTGAVPAPVQRRTTGASEAPSRRAWTRKSLDLGMSDDEVLNMPGWGRPSRVVRARMPREWHEDWAYRTPGSDEERRLHFVNARLVAVDVEPAGPPPIQLTSR